MLDSTSADSPCLRFLLGEQLIDRCMEFKHLIERSPFLVHYNKNIRAANIDSAITNVTVYHVRRFIFMSVLLVQLFSILPDTGSLLS